MHQATLKTVSKDGKSISKALNVDNEGDNKLRIITRRGGKGEVITEVETNSIRTLLSTLDDLVHCQGVAEKLIQRKGEDG